MGEVIAFTNHKGGCAKTTLVVNLAHALRVRGYRVLVVDLDPQANTTRHLLAGRKLGENESIIGALLDQVSNITAYPIPCPLIENVDVLGSSIKLMSAIEEKIKVASLVPAKVLVQKMKVLREVYDVILIDTPPNLYLAPAIALCAADWFVVPVQAGDVYSLDGIEDLFNLVHQAKDLNPDLKFAGAIVTRFDGRKTIHKATLAAVKQVTHFGGKVFSTALSDGTAIEQAAAQGKSVLMTDRNSSVARDIVSIGKELAATTGLMATGDASDPEDDHAQS